jgi:hypothetical protein
MSSADQPKPRIALRRSLTALAAPIIYLVGSELCVKMELLIGSHNQ